MNRLAHWMMRLYPARWRARYGEELDALLADTGADARVVADLCVGGMRMQFSTWSFPKLVLAFGLIGVVAGAAYSLTLADRYTSEATLVMTPSGVPGAVELQERVIRLEQQMLSRTALSGIIMAPELQLYTDERRNTPLEDVIGEMQRSIRIQVMPTPGPPGPHRMVFQMVFSYPDKVKAQRTLQALVTSFLATNQSIQSTGTLNNGTVWVLDYPSLPITPDYPNVPMVMLAGFLAGVLVACVWRFFQRTGLIARRFGLVAVSCGTVVVLGVFVASQRHELRVYRSVATIQFRGHDAMQISTLKQEALKRSSLSTIVNDPRLQLYRNQLRTSPLEDVLLNMKSHITFRQLSLRSGGPNDIVDVAFNYPDRYKAQQTVGLILNVMEEADQRLYPSTTAPQPETPVALEVTDPPSVPDGPSWPNRPVMAATGGLAGMALACVVALIRRQWKPAAELPADAVNG